MPIMALQVGQRTPRMMPVVVVVVDDVAEVFADGTAAIGGEAGFGGGDGVVAAVALFGTLVGSLAATLTGLREAFVVHVAPALGLMGLGAAFVGARTL